MNEEKELISEKADEKPKKLTGFKKIIIIECAVLIVLAVVLRVLVFPYLAQGGMKHVVVATHAFMIGLTATVFSIFAVLFRRLWKTHKKYVLIPAIFTVFGYLLLMAANDINF